MMVCDGLYGGVMQAVAGRYERGQHSLAGLRFTVVRAAVATKGSGSPVRRPEHGRQ